MTTTSTGQGSLLSALVAAETRAWMGRLQVRQSELARRLGENDEWLSKRLRGLIPINLNELQRIAEALGVSIIDLMPASAQKRRTTNPDNERVTYLYPPEAPPEAPTRPAGRPHDRRPAGHPAGSTRPASVRTARIH